jgi:hypothetical protein
LYIYISIYLVIAQGFKLRFPMQSLFRDPTSGLHAQDKALKDAPKGLPENLVTIPTATVEPEVVGSQDWCWGCGI